MDLKKELLTVNKEIKALTKMVEKLIVATGKVEKSKRKTAKSKAVKKAPAKKGTAKKPERLSAIDAVFAIIKRSKKGIDTAALMKKTGFNEKKIHNTVYKLKKKGKIKAEKKGVYHRS